MRTIRIDDEVWAWLKQLGQPFEDTPNSVLRRVARLEGEPASSVASAANTKPRSERQHSGDNPMTGQRTSMTVRLGRKVTGDQLNRRYRLGALHALYHKDGTFYERLSRFPGILCDSKGFLRYDSEKQFFQDPRLNIGVKVNVYGGLSSHPRYQRFPDERGSG